MYELLKKFSGEYKSKLIELASKYDTMMQNGGQSKEVIFIEAFVANVMVLAIKQKNQISAN
jgi:hypothetical protein